MASLPRSYDGDNPEDVTGLGLVTAEPHRNDGANSPAFPASIASGMDVKGRAKGFASVPGFVGPQEVMRQYCLRSIMALIAVIAVSIWIGMEIEKDWPSRRIVHTVDKRVPLTTTVPSYATRRPVQQQSKVKRQRSADAYPAQSIAALNLPPPHNKNLRLDHRARRSNWTPARLPFGGIARGLE